MSNNDTVRFIKIEDRDMLLSSIAFSNCVVIPNLLLKNSVFSTLPDGAHKMYGYFLHQLINDFGFPDYRGRYCIRYSIKNIEDSINCSYVTAVSYLNMLKHHGFIDVEHLGRCKDILIYLVLLDDFIIE
jgi:hypothetical protein